MKQMIDSNLINFDEINKKFEIINDKLNRIKLKHYGDELRNLLNPIYPLLFKGIHRRVVVHTFTNYFPQKLILSRGGLYIGGGIYSKPEKLPLFKSIDMFISYGDDIIKLIKENFKNSNIELIEKIITVFNKNKILFSDNKDLIPAGLSTTIKSTTMKEDKKIILEGKKTKITSIAINPIKELVYIYLEDNRCMPYFLNSSVNYVPALIILLLFDEINFVLDELLNKTKPLRNKYIKMIDELKRILKPLLLIKEL